MNGNVGNTTKERDLCCNNSKPKAMKFGMLRHFIHLLRATEKNIKYASAPYSWQLKLKINLQNYSLIIYKSLLLKVLSFKI